MVSPTQCPVFAPGLGDDPVTLAMLTAVGRAFQALGRGVLCLGSELEVLHVSPKLADLLGEEASRGLVGGPVSDVLGVELFGARGPLADALRAGQTREGWRAVIQGPEGGRTVVSLTAAPIPHGPEDVCDQRIQYIVVVRPAQDVHPEELGDEVVVFGGLVTRSPLMTKLFRLVESLRRSEATVLVTGESGTGKELLAGAVHVHSPRAEGPFVAVNCGALPGDLLESELFGHVRGAFTGAARDRVGRFELARAGTIFLDEVGDIPLPLQVKLLRVLQERTFERVGESESRTAEVRVVAATNADLEQEVRAGRFREDLYYRLRVVPMELPPLRDRREDVEPLARVFLTRLAARYGRALRFSPQAVRYLERYWWPGNVRELQNAIEYAVATCSGQTVTPEDLPPHLVHDHRPVGGQEPTRSEGGTRAADPEASERDRLVAALTAHRWKRAPAAAALGMSRTTLWRRMRELGIDD